MMHIGYDKTKDFFSPFLKGVPERQRGGGILERIRNSKILSIRKGTKIPLSCAQSGGVLFLWAMRMRTIHSPFKKGETFIDLSPNRHNRHQRKPQQHKPIFPHITASLNHRSTA